MKVLHVEKADPLAPAGVRTSTIGGWPEGIDLKARLATEDLYKNHVMYRCIDQLARAVASTPWMVVSEDGSPATSRKAKRVMQVLNNPNPIWSRAALIYYMTASYMTAGQAFIVKVNGVDGVQEIWPSPAGKTEIVVSNSGVGISAYTVRGGTDEKVYPVSPEGKSDMARWWKPTLAEDTMNGQSAASVAHEPLKLHNMFMERQLDFMMNSIHTSGILSTDVTVPDEQMTNIADKLRLFKNGKRRSGDLFVISGAKWEFQELSSEIDKLLPLDAKNSAARDIALTMGVPAMILGLPGENTYANYSEARRSFWIDTIIPYYLDPLQSMLTQAFFDVGDGVLIRADYDSIPAVREARREQFKMAEGASFLTIDEKREVLGYDKVGASKGGDMIIAVEKARTDRIRAENIGTSNVDDDAVDNPIEGDPKDKPKPPIVDPNKKPAGSK
jgi:HK97 family phage portal protein